VRAGEEGGVIQINVPLIGVWLAAGIGGALGAAVVVFSFLRVYIDTDRARHDYMARQIQGLRRKHKDWESVGVYGGDDFEPSRRLGRLVHYLLDKLYGRGRPEDPRREA
jgi:hypothetical protein